MRVLIKPHYSIGDIVATSPYVDRYRRDNHGDEIHFMVNDDLVPLLAPSYPDVSFIPRSTSVIDYFFDRIIPLNYGGVGDSKFGVPVQAGFAMQLGYEHPEYIRPKVTAPGGSRPMKSRYVCLGIHSTMQLKYWNHPSGRSVQGQSPNWDELCAMIRKAGLIPVVLEKVDRYGWMPMLNGIPKRANKQVGLTLSEAANFIDHCEFYIGLSSGMSWVAHAMGKRVAMIANFANDKNEFEPSEDFIRIEDRTVCNGCWSRIPFDGMDWYWCPHHQGTSREFECHKAITPARVFDEIQKWIQ